MATTTPSFPGFPLGVTAGRFINDFDLDFATSFNPAFVTASGGSLVTARDRLVAGFNAGTTYFNIHTGPNPANASPGFGGGEIRGFIQVPEPSNLALMALSLAALGATSRRKSA